MSPKLKAPLAWLGVFIVLFIVQSILSHIMRESENPSHDLDWAFAAMAQGAISIGLIVWAFKALPRKKPNDERIKLDILQDTNVTLARPPARASATNLLVQTPEHQDRQEINAEAFQRERASEAKATQRAARRAQWSAYWKSKEGKVLLYRVVVVLLLAVVAYSSVRIADSLERRNAREWQAKRTPKPVW